MTQTLPETTTTRESVVGKPVDRVDGTAKTTGEARFTAEFSHPDLTHAALVHATVSRGRITAIDTSAASAVPGVVTVLTHHNAPALKSPRKVTPTDLSTMASGTSVNYLNTDEVHWDGQPIAVVVAESALAAREAAALVRVTYETAESTVDFTAEEPAAKPQKNNLVMQGSAKKGDAEAAFTAAPVKVDRRFTTPPLHHNAIEPHATLAVWDGDRLTVHDATQSIDWLRSHLALRFGIPTRSVRVIAPFVGGGFGGKGFIWAGTILTALAARATGRPVRLVLTRESVYRTVGGRTPSTQRVALGARTDGTLTSLIHTSVTRLGRVGGTPEAVTSQSKHLYAAENILVRQNLVELDLVSNAAMRAPGEAIGTFALEASIDELAYELGMDPIELRMHNEPERNPIDGKQFARRHLREAYRVGAERFGWADRTPEPRSMRDGRWLVGMGVASAFHPSMLFVANVVVRLSVDGTVLVHCGLQEMGMGSATVQAQVAADALGVPVESVRVEYGDSTLPMAPGAGGSMQTASVANSLLAACEKLERKLTKLGRSPQESPAAVLAREGLPSLEVSVGSDTRLGRMAGQLRFMSKFLMDQRRWMKAALGAHFCEVRVDPDTGEVRVSRWTASFDVGRVLNAKTATSQLKGGIVMGIGMALAEQTLIDPRNGRIMNPSLAEYHVPVHADIPPIDITYLDEPDPTMPLGLVGIGEVSITGVAGAIANAIHHATGKRIRDLPITLDKLL
ncbi:xanthine dehydrogenase family protein molybdopterin-binding subunit [Prauserella cavernicola]|uniref:Xanthine dehydrogenase family protein molybdopterin-binding subunit n=1 Tax=Prauserella cavernicola TaxID=2800127 RepID=A0A934QS23_9PSEU|nr:xanthine dehydrogenase family protein molybdopterin-binding subunit [Prauserella cavernicola]MBK1785510.1 xanthine dehydrogenase family protein molybdopterin-binding subunit [Prauserella cavernicola]